MSGIAIDEEIAIRRSPQDVFAFVADLQHLPAWRRGISRVRRTSELTYLAEGRRRSWPYEITAQEPGVQLSARVAAAGLSFDETYALVGIDDRTWVRLSIVADVEGSRALTALLRRILRRQARASLRRLQSVLGSPAVADHPDEPPEDEPFTPG